MNLADFTLKNFEGQNLEISRTEFVFPLSKLLFGNSLSKKYIRMSKSHIFVSELNRRFDRGVHGNYGFSLKLVWPMYVKLSETSFVVLKCPPQSIEAF